MTRSVSELKGEFKKTLEKVTGCKWSVREGRGSMRNTLTVSAPKARMQDNWTMTDYDKNFLEQATNHDSFFDSMILWGRREVADAIQFMRRFQ